MKRILVLLAEGFEELEAMTMIDLFRRAGFEVVSCGLGEKVGPVKASRGVQIVPDAVLSQVRDKEFDLVALPGGQPGSDNLRGDERVLDMLRRQHGSGGMVAAICAAPMVLAAAGILDGRVATGYPGCLESMNLKDTQLVADPVVVSDRVITSRGPGTAMDFALKLIEIMGGSKLLAQVESGLQRC